MSVQIIAVAVFFLVIGGFALVRPGKVLSFVGVPVETVDGRNEVRAVYGGMCVAIGLILLESPYLGTASVGIVATVMVLLAGMAAGRLVGGVFERPGIMPMVFFASEAIGAGLLYSVLDTNLLGA